MGSVSANWLAQLAPAHAPPPSGWWPPAPGWWLLAMVMLAAAAILTYWLRRPQQRLRRAAFRELRLIDSSAIDDATLATLLENLLRRYAIARFGREPAASLCGDRWVEFITSHGGSDFAGEAGRDFLRAAYGGISNTRCAAWMQGAQRFIGGRS